MLATFPALDHRPPAAPPQAAVPRYRAGDEPRTAGPMPGAYHPDSQGKISHAAPLADAPDRVQAAPGLGFGDVLDVLNPLQHIPLVNLAYRGLTGDAIGPAAQIIGGAIFGGPIGALAGTASAIVEIQTGRTPGDAVLSALNGDQPARAALAYVDLSGPIEKRYNFNRKV